MKYKVSRNIEASFIDFLKDSIESYWNNINIIKGFNKAYELSLPTIAIRAENTTYDKVEIGSNNFTRTVQVYIDIFADSDGLRLDLKDSLIEILKDGLPYYEYTIIKEGRIAKVDEKEQKGLIRITNISDTAINFNTDDKTKLDSHDKFRHLLTLSVSIGKVE